MRLPVIILSAIVLQACSTRCEYAVNAIQDGLIRIDGERNENIWSNAVSITSFKNPWNREVSPATSFSMLKDNNHLYFCFDVKDNEILLEPAVSNERDIEKEDRVELFFSKDKEMKEYYCIEMDPGGRTLSYAAGYYRQFNFNWEPPAGFQVAAQVYTGGYTVEGSVPIAFIQSLCANNRLYLGVYRAEFSKKDTTVVENWLTWIDPQTSFPDFHVPATLGVLMIGGDGKKTMY